MKNMQITLGDENIDSLIEELKKLKGNNSRIIRIGGGKDLPELIMIHKNFKIPEKAKER